MKQRRIVERWKEAQDGAFWAEVNKEEQRFIDEIATNRAALGGRNRHEA